MIAACSYWACNIGSCSCLRRCVRLPFCNRICKIRPRLQPFFSPKQSTTGLLSAFQKVQCNSSLLLVREQGGIEPWIFWQAEFQSHVDHHNQPEPAHVLFLQRHASSPANFEPPSGSIPFQMRLSRGCFCSTASMLHLQPHTPERRRQTKQRRRQINNKHK